MNASAKIYIFIMDYEKFIPKLDNDAAGYATIGYGHLVHYGKVGTNKIREKEFEKGITQIDALELLKKDIRTKAENDINRLVKADITQNQFDALVSLTYNIGVANFAISTLLKKVNLKETDAEIITDCFKRWNKASVNGILTELKGLTKRRQQEADIYNKNKYVSTH